ncbi:MAG: class I SAM-dependent methyltransferase [Candidatus Diapherotrites archaeon]|nr:class I SAM-dependent methyltransferase [Candidatus Diapherotrites archaeon]
MPVFRGGKIPQKKRGLLGKEISRYWKGKRQYGEAENWCVKNTPFKKIKGIFPAIFMPVNGKPSFIEETAQAKGKPAVVLDWGCENGRTGKELAREYGDKVRVYGYSKDSYPSWAKAGGVKFIHATKEDLPRYLKNGSVDLIYSYFGLDHLSEKEGGLAQHLQQLVPKLSVGGKIALNLTDISLSLNERIMDEIQGAVVQSGAVMERENIVSQGSVLHIVYITRKK